MTTKTTGKPRAAGFGARLALLLGTVLLTGCASMDEDECVSADWQLIGYEDGAAGRSAAHIGERREACADYRISPDMTAYRKGREAGLEEFCRPQNGFRLGQAGHGYAGVCPANLDGEFRAAYDAGRHVYTARSQVRSTQNRIRSKERQLSSIQKQYSSTASELISDATSTARRAELLVETTQSAQRQGELEAEIDVLRLELQDQRRLLADIESKGQTW